MQSGCVDARFAASSTFGDGENATTYLLPQCLSIEEAAGALAPLSSEMCFRRGFESETSWESLKHLLNAMMRRPDESFEIEHIHSVECYPAKSRSLHFEVRCELKSGDRVIVELQKEQLRNGVVDRLIAYRAKQYSKQWGPTGGPLVPVRVLALLNFLLDRDPTRCGSLVQHYHIKHDGADPSQSPSSLLAERMKALSSLTIVQLPLAPERLDEGTSDAEKWAHLLQWSQKYSYGALPKPLHAKPFLAAASGALYATMTAQERETMRVEWKDLRLWLQQDDQIAEAKERLAAAEAKIAEDRKKRLEAEERQLEAEAKIVELEAKIAELEASGVKVR
jgi:PD-(D/E)XK nuclease family transposase